MIETTNLLILFNDQYSKHILDCYGGPIVGTPCPDAPMADGVRSDAAYASCPICMLSRTSMTIRDYRFRHGHWDNAYAYDGKVRNWDSRLTEQGSSMTTTGKPHFKGDILETSFPDQRIPFHIKDGIGGIYGEIHDKQIIGPQFCKVLEETRVGKSGYTRCDREVTRRTTEFLRTEGSVPKSPFALMAGSVAPHFPLAMPQEYVDLHSDPEALLFPVQFDQEERPHHPMVGDYRRYCCQEDLLDSVKRNAIRAYYGLRSLLDAQMGVVLKALEETGLDKNARALYCADHGDTMGERRLFLKSIMYEGSVSIPMIFSGPGIRKGERNATGVSLVGVCPTAIEYLGGAMCEKGRRLSSHSLLASTGGRGEPERAVYSEYLGFGIYTGEFTLRRERFKYIHYVGERPQLLDLREDPEEYRDLAGNPEYYEVIGRVEKELHTLMDPEEVKEDTRIAQRTLLDRLGGQEVFLRTSRPSLFSPIPDLEEK